MPGFAYLDASALIKLAVREAETSALENFVLDLDALFTSVIAAVEIERALVRTGHSRASDQADSLLEAVHLTELTPAIREQAGRLAPPLLRTLDAIHVATAASLPLPNLIFVTYDDRQGEAATRRGLRVHQPGRGETRSRRRNRTAARA